MMLIKLIVELVTGGISGFAANKLMGSDSSSQLKNLGMGLIGGNVWGI